MFECEDFRQGILLDNNFVVLDNSGCVWFFQDYEFVRYDIDLGLTHIFGMRQNVYAFSDSGKLAIFDFGNVNLKVSSEVSMYDFEFSVDCIFNEMITFSNSNTLCLNVDDGMHSKLGPDMSKTGSSKNNHLAFGGDDQPGISSNLLENNLGYQIQVETVRLGNSNNKPVRDFTVDRNRETIITQEPILNINVGTRDRPTHIDNTESLRAYQRDFKLGIDRAKHLSPIGLYDRLPVRDSEKGDRTFGSNYGDSIINKGEFYDRLDHLFKKETLYNNGNMMRQELRNLDAKILTIGKIETNKRDLRDSESDRPTIDFTFKNILDSVDKVAASRPPPAQARAHNFDFDSLKNKFADKENSNRKHKWQDCSPCEELFPRKKRDASLGAGLDKFLKKNLETASIGEKHNTLEFQLHKVHDHIELNSYDGFGSDYRSTGKNNRYQEKALTPLNPKKPDPTLGMDMLS